MSAGVVDEVKSKLDIVQVIGEHLQLKKAGTSYKAVCPFHGEKTPSFFVSADKQIWHCFGCGEGGDVFGFIMRIEGMDFPEALRHLAKKAGVVLRKEDAGLGDEKKLLKDINRWAGRFWHEILRMSPAAERARAYVAKRRIADEMVEDFLLGYAPDSWDATISFLRKKGYRDEDIFRAGLASRQERGSGYFDRFRDRLMFAITDMHGDVIGFTGRVMPLADGSDPKDTGKYMNSPQTLVYDKGRVLFGLDKAKQEIRRKNLAVVVEGNMDAIASHEAGIKNVVASSGTAFTPDQLALLKRFTDRLVLSFDNDAAGEIAARRSIDSAVAHGFVVRVLRLPDGIKDPDDCVRRDPALWTQAIEGAVPFMAWYLQLARERTDFHDPESVRGSSQTLIAEVAKLPAVAERSFWIREISAMFRTPESLLFEEVQRLVKPVPKAAVAAIREVKRLTRIELVSQFVLAIGLCWPDHADAVVAGVPADVLEDDLRDLYRDFVLYYNAQRHGGDRTPAFRLWSAQSGNRDIAERAAYLELLAEKEFGELTADARREAIVRLIGELKQLHKARRQRELTYAMAQAERSGDMTRISEIQAQLNELIV